MVSSGGPKRQKERPTATKKELAAAKIELRYTNNES